MDRIPDSGSDDVGSIPAGCTSKKPITLKASDWLFYVFIVTDSLCSLEPLVGDIRVVAHLFCLREILSCRRFIELFQSHTSSKDVEIGVVSLRSPRGLQVGRRLRYLIDIQHTLRPVHIK